MNNLAMRLLHLPAINATSDRPNWDFWKYLMFSNIYDFLIYVFEENPDEVIEITLACDKKEGSWRSKLYTPYKGNRVKRQDIDWDLVFAQLGSFLYNIETLLPWKVIAINGCEADDIIAVVSRDAEAKGIRTIIHSGDSDYLQLKSDKIDIYVPHRDEYIDFPCTVNIANTKVRCNSPEEFLQLAVLTGQGCKDNVYNIKTPTDWQPTEEKKRKPPFGVKAAQKILNEGLETSLEKLGFTDNYYRNKTLIDFACIPEEIQTIILNEYSSYKFPEPNIPEFLNHYEWPSLQAQAEDLAALICITAGLEPPSDATFAEEEAQEPYNLSEDPEVDFIL
jgi:5'-3' exonuclease